MQQKNDNDIQNTNINWNYYFNIYKEKANDICFNQKDFRSVAKQILRDYSSIKHNKVKTDFINRYSWDNIAQIEIDNIKNLI